EKPTQTLRLVSVKLKFELNCESDSDDGDSNKNQLKKKTKNGNVSEPRFEFATEVQLKLSSQLLTEIQRKGLSKPKFIKVLFHPDDSTFYIYVSIGG
ncbi:MAG: hypothetical protein ACMG6E_09450, partial [Candidatus Roizmanbacteria bacterium]